MDTGMVNRYMCQYYKNRADGRVSTSYTNMIEDLEEEYPNQDVNWRDYYTECHLSTDLDTDSFDYYDYNEFDDGDE